MAEKSKETKADKKDNEPAQAELDWERDDDGDAPDSDDDQAPPSDEGNAGANDSAAGSKPAAVDKHSHGTGDTKKAGAKKAGAKKAGAKKAGAKKAGAKKAGAKKAGAKKASSTRRPRGGGKGARKSGSPTRNIVFFVLVVGGIAAAFAVLGNQTGGGRAAAPKWKVGETVDVELTLVATDKRNLACAAKSDIKGRHCAFVAQNKRRSTVEDPGKSDKLLQPYTTTTGAQLMAAGLWAQPALSKALPKARFSVKCKFVVEDKAKTAFVQWKPGEGWHPANGWYTGVVKSCSAPQGQK